MSELIPGLITLIKDNKLKSLEGIIPLFERTISEILTESTPTIIPPSNKILLLPFQVNPIPLLLIG